MGNINAMTVKCRTGKNVVLWKFYKRNKKAFSIQETKMRGLHEKK